MNTMNNLDFARVAITARLREQSNANLRADVDHAEALGMDAQFDADREAQREQEHHDSISRLQAAADQHLRDNLPPPESCCARDARINEGFDETPTDREIIENYVEAFGGTNEQAFLRISQMVMDALDPTGDMMREAGSSMRTTIEFTNAGTFAAARAAEQWLRDRGFSYGPSQADGPQAIWYGDCTISKWRNLSAAEKRECHATLDGNGREGPMRITLHEAATPEAREAFNRAEQAA
jgi:hypothetical protein